ncbi:unnamed protein product [Schistosoma margrebowiei]|uniref:Uncharacterized protein n=1 Tax=Schistosoma margrebowiei TaxID=48269 RepID=A0A183LJY7_9TREM|nr:unnamed protein product [Schistosoma margrebowiei]
MHTQSYISLTRPHHEEPDRLYLHQEKFIRSMEDVRIGRRTDIPSDQYLPGGCQDGTETKKGLDNGKYQQQPTVGENKLTSV